MIPITDPRFWSLIKGHHRVRNKVGILDMSHQLIQDASLALIDGNIDIDEDADVTRSGSMTLLDPGNLLRLDTGQANSGPQFFNRMVTISQDYVAMDGSLSYNIPLFTGPITDVSRTGPLLSCTFSGKELYASDAQRLLYTWPKNWTKANVIYDALLQKGERSFDFRSGYGGQTLGGNWAVEAGEAIFPKLKELARSMGHLLYYDAYGRCVLKPLNYGPTMTLDSGWLLDEPEVTFDTSSLFNMVRFIGPEVDNAGNRLTYEAWPDPSHPYSPLALARNNTYRIIPYIMSDDNVSLNEMIAISWQELVRGLQSVVNINATALTIPVFEEGDWIHINHPRFNGVVPVKKITIQLVGDASMSIGFLSTSTMGSVVPAGTKMTVLGGNKRDNKKGKKGKKGKKAKGSARNKVNARKNKNNRRRRKRNSKSKRSKK